MGIKTLPGGTSAGINQTIRGTILINSGATLNTATIASVNTAKAQLRYLGISFSGGGEGLLALTNATTITANRSGTTGSDTVGYDLTEWT